MDWDEDGLKDLIVGQFSGYIRFYKNIGVPGSPELTLEGYLQLNNSNINVGLFAAPWIDDWNEDGLKDLLVGASDGNIYLYINTGTNSQPVFEVEDNVRYSTGQIVDIGTKSAPNIIDLDGDGLKDLVTGCDEGSVLWCRNTGTNADPQLDYQVELLTGELPFQPSGTNRTAPIDWDGDGDVDIIYGGYDGRLRLFLQVEETIAVPSISMIINSGLQIPSSGGWINFTVDIDNSTPETVVFDFWTESISYNMFYYFPVFVRNDIRMPAFSNLSRSPDQYVPASVNGGTHYYYGYIGDFENLQVYAFDSFTFQKDFSDQIIVGGEWELEGFDNSGEQAAASIAEVPALFTVYPNPFNPNTTLSFNLPEASRVRLAVYDLTGHKVTDLVNGWRDAGYHEVIFDGSNLASGIYIYRLQAGDFDARGKMMLLR